MWKYFLALGVFIFSVQLGKAQNKEFGILGGVSYTNWRGSLKELGGTIEGRIAYNFGVFADFHLSDDFSISPRIKYSSQGFRNETFIRQTIDEPEVILKTATRFNYLNIPITAKLNVLPNAGFHAGPQLGFLLNANSEVIEAGAPGFEGQKSKIETDFDIDYGINLGLFYEIKDDLFVELTYYYGLANITNEDLQDFSNFNSVFQLNLGYSLF